MRISVCIVTAFVATASAAKLLEPVPVAELSTTSPGYLECTYDPTCDSAGCIANIACEHTFSLHGSGHHFPFFPTRIASPKSGLGVDQPFVAEDLRIVINEPRVHVKKVEAKVCSEPTFSGPLKVVCSCSEFPTVCPDATVFSSQLAKMSYALPSVHLLGCSIGTLQTTCASGVLTSSAKYELFKLGNKVEKLAMQIGHGPVGMSYADIATAAMTVPRSGATSPYDPTLVFHVNGEMVDLKGHNELLNKGFLLDDGVVKATLASRCLWVSDDTTGQVTLDQEPIRAATSISTDNMCNSAFQGSVLSGVFDNPEPIPLNLTVTPLTESDSVVVSGPTVMPFSVTIVKKYEQQIDLSAALPNSMTEPMYDGKSTVITTRLSRDGYYVVSCDDEEILLKGKQGSNNAAIARRCGRVCYYTTQDTNCQTVNIPSASPGPVSFTSFLRVQAHQASEIKLTTADKVGIYTPIAFIGLYIVLILVQRFWRKTPFSTKGFWWLMPTYALMKLKYSALKAKVCGRR